MMPDVPARPRWVARLESRGAWSERQSIPLLLPGGEPHGPRVKLVLWLWNFRNLNAIDIRLPGCALPAIRIGNPTAAVSCKRPHGGALVEPKLEYSWRNMPQCIARYEYSMPRALFAGELPRGSEFVYQQVAGMPSMEGVTVLQARWE